NFKDITVLYANKRSSSLKYISSCTSRNYCLLSKQSENAIGAYRTFDKTSFSCTGRPAGYYADIETGCQIYHMCDGLGRQFSYSCPNTTLFQQRMLICDHWYMVNCSKAESDYAANLLIGQRDKPFVNDEEENIRTPRPDLLDRPYAPDYSGESFRTQYQKPLLNAIFDKDDGKHRLKSPMQVESQRNFGQQRWKIPPPSRIILPPAYEAQIAEKDKNFRPKLNSVTPTSATKKPSTVVGPPAVKHLPGVRFSQGAAALHQRQDEHIQYDNDDLGTSHSTRYNTSFDLNSAEDNRQTKIGKNSYNAKAVHKNEQRTTVGTTTSRPITTKSNAFINVKKPSKIYQPPLLYPIYNLEDTTAINKTRPTIRGSTSAPFSTRSSTVASTSTLRPTTKPTTLAGKPFTRIFSNNTFVTASFDFAGESNNLHQQFLDVNKLSKDIRTAAPAQGFKAPTTPKPFSSTTSAIETPAKTLLPPFTDFIQHDVATTQGPPIYYEWKIPSDGLEPPKLDPPIGVDGREYPASAIDYNVLNSKNTEKNTNFTTTRPSFSQTIKEMSSQTNEITTQQKAAASVKTPTAQLPPAPSASTNVKADISEIRKEWSVPEYAFPLEHAGRTGYLSSDVYNSFQLKIPDGHNVADEHLHWFGENPDCPECHPSYVIPGTCQPCLRR
uniref:Chitin-binding type-2 domain-containing protein n=1 Tax=Glossina pallidipes TaxID=7398 RepID=A0A1B0A3M0_GLOPL